MIARADDAKDPFESIRISSSGLGFRGVPSSIDVLRVRRQASRPSSIPASRQPTRLRSDRRGMQSLPLACFVEASGQCGTSEPR
jgi:hypothetical protein